MEDKNREMARRVASAVREAGGRTYYVGGYVRDQILGRVNKDIDIEVHGITVQSLKGVLETLGEPLEMGASFGIMGLRHYDLDIAMPRAEAVTGRGQEDCEALIDPFVGEEKAACRRDLTMNALMQDVLTGEILDFYGGQDDIALRRIRHVDDRSFAEDPLRVFRVAQFAARFGFSVAEETTVLCATLRVDFLPSERVLGELEKALMKAERPSVFFEELRKMDQLSVWFPGLAALIGVPQNAAYHPEGDVWAHTMQVVDEAARLRGEASEPLWFMMAALCHDFGKATTTEERDGSIHAYGHEAEGVSLAKAFLARFTREAKLTKYVLNMVELHMQPNSKAKCGASLKAFVKMFDRSVCPEDLLLLAKADHMGRLGAGTNREELTETYAETDRMLTEMFAAYRERMSQPYVMGRDLVDAGIEPGPLFGEALSYAHKLRLAGIPKDEQLRHTIAYIRSAERHQEISGNA